MVSVAAAFKEWKPSTAGHDFEAGLLLLSTDSFRAAYSDWKGRNRGNRSGRNLILVKAAIWPIIGFGIDVPFLQSRDQLRDGEFDIGRNGWGVMSDHPDAGISTLFYPIPSRELCSVIPFDIVIVRR